MFLPHPFRTAGFALLGPLLTAAPLVTLQTGATRFGIDAQGSFCLLQVQGRNLLPAGQSAPVLSLRLDGRLQAPTGARWEPGTRSLTLLYPGGTAVLTLTAKPTHLVLAVREVHAAGRVELAVWGPYPTVIGDLVGETVGVVQDATAAFGIQALNPRTLGGAPTEDDTFADTTADDPGHYPDLAPALGRNALYRGDTARRTPYGSLLQAYVRNRAEARTITNGGHAGFPVPALEDGGVAGSRIALFGCARAQALETLGAIEVAEGLPHPLLDGVWAKATRAATASYLIQDFSEATIGEAIETTRRAGLKYLYHSSPFETWGHFALKPDAFPRGWDGLKACVDQARSAGLQVGVHSLSNFITPNDPYVSPVPDPRLARTGTSVLAGAVDAGAKELPVADPAPFRKASDLNTVRIGTELVKFRAVSETAPWRLLGCRRGAFGTRAAAHGAGTAVDKLMDHSYKVFLTDADLSLEMAGNLARVCNYAGIRQISLDGLEGNDATGHGEYGRIRFTQAWREALDPERRDGFINDASRATHFTWHTTTRMNWGEPWGAGFREGQTQYRFQNQLYFTRNLMPRMLGWFALRPETTREDIEWMLARAAGYDAGFALAMSEESTAQMEAAHSDARASGAVPVLLEAVRQWETARMAGAFPPEIRALLRDDRREFHLEAAGAGRWSLFEARVTRSGAERGAFENPHGAQPLQWVLQSTAKEPLRDVTVSLDGKRLATLAVPLPPGGSLLYRGGPEAVLLAPDLRELGRVPVDAGASLAGPGSHATQVGCADGTGALKLEVRTYGPAIPLVAPAPPTGTAGL